MDIHIVTYTQSFIDNKYPKTLTLQAFIDEGRADKYRKMAEEKGMPGDYFVVSVALDEGTEEPVQY